MAAMLVAAMAISAGCYERVVGTRGIGGASVGTYKPSYEPGPIDDLLGPGTVGRERGSMGVTPRKNQRR